MINSKFVWLCFTTACMHSSISIAEETIDLDQIVVSATRWETVGVPTASSILVIDRKDIKESGAQYLVDVLRGKGGVQIFDQFGDGSRATVSMRGFGGNAQSNSLILVDGRRLNNSDLKAADLNTVSLRDVERIEIIQGTSAVLYGDQAVGGVINIITRRPDDFNAKLQLEYGSYNHQSEAIGLEDRFENGLEYRLAFERLLSDNFRNNNKKDYENGFAQIALNREFGRLFFEHQRINEDIKLPGAIFARQIAANRKHTRFPNDFNDSNTEISRVGGLYNLNDRWRAQAEFTNRRSEINGILSNTVFIQERHNQSVNPRIQGLIPFNGGDIHLVMGADLENIDYGISSFFTFATGVQKSKHTIRSLYLQSVIPLGNQVSMTAGLRHAWYKNDLRLDTFSFPSGIKFRDEQFIPSFGLTFKPSNDWRLFFKYEENYRFPLIDEETLVPPGVVGLETQTGESFESGLEWNNGKYALKLLAYRLELENEIDFDPTAGAFGGGANTNLAPTSRDGFIAEISGQFAANLSATAQYSYVDAVFDQGSSAGNRIPLVARNQLYAGLNYDINQYFSLYTEIQAIDDRVVSGDYANTSSLLPGYMIANMNLLYKYKDFSVSARVNNLMDKNYSDFATNAFNPFPTIESSFYPAPERNFLLTIGYNYSK